MPGTRPCNSCGSVVSADARFCGKCGADVSTPSMEQSAAGSGPHTHQVACSACGAVLSPENKFCPSCGAPGSEGATIQSKVSLKRITSQRLTEATAGEFEILERIGYGAMGSVYLARDVALSRRVAIKVVSPALLMDETMIARFRLEAQTVASLRHPNIVNIHGVRQFGDLHFFVMDFIDGPALRTIMKTHGALDIAVTQALLFEVGSALSYAHRRGRGVIHRDVKPANIMVDREGHAVVTDFGISKVGASQGGLTQTGATIGTPEYMSPQQCRDEELTGASDQYALGIVAYEMLCGEVPFKGSNYLIMVAHAEQEPPPIRDLRPDCPQAVEDAVMRMLKKSPEDRWPDLDSAVVGLGGHPLGHRDPVRSLIVDLAESVIAETASGLDTASPLSPVPGMIEPSEGPVAMTISGLPETVEVGDTFKLQAEVRGSSGSILPLTDLVWSTNDPSIVTVDDGAVEAHAPGSASLTAAAGPVANTVIVTVMRPTVAEISVLPSSIRIEAGGRINLTASVQDRHGDALERSVRWISDADHFAAIADKGSGTGEVMALTPGTTVITAEVDVITGTAEIIVEEAKVRQIILSEAPASIQVGEVFRIEATVMDAWEASMDRPIEWESDAPDVVTVEDGVVTAVGMGTGRIKATCEGKSTGLFLKVSPAAIQPSEQDGPTAASVAESPAVEKPAEKKPAGGRLPTAAPPTGTPVAEKPPESPVPPVVPVTDTPAAKKPPEGQPPTAAPVADAPAAKKPATTRPQARPPRVVAAKRSNRGVWIGVASVIVVASLFVAQRFLPSGSTGSGQGASVTLSSVADTLQMNDSLRLVADVQDGAGAALDGVIPTWTSSDPDVATVDDSGLVVARAAGLTTIRALLGGAEAAAEILVREIPMVAAADTNAAPAEVLEAEARPTETPRVETTPITAPQTAAPVQQSPAPEATTPLRVTSVTVQVQNTSMQVGYAESPGLSVLDQSGGSMSAADYQARWRSTNTSVLAVGPRLGSLSARGAGQAYLVVEVNGVSDSVLVRVESVVAEVRIEGDDLSLEVGSTAQLAATPLDRLGRSLSDHALRWSSSDDGVVSVHASGGRLEAIRPGTATIVAAAGGMEGQITVTIVAPASAVPSVTDVRVELERYLALLTAGDADAVLGLFGGTGDEERHRALLDRMGEQSFAAELVEIDPPAADGLGATVGFEVELSWRSFTGATRARTVEFHASLDATSAGWRLSSCVLAPGTEP